MKKALFVGLLALLGLITSCQEDKLDEPMLTLSSEEQVSIDSQAHEIVVGVETNQARWSAVSNASWLEATRAGNSLQLTIEENTDLSPRQGVVVVSAGGLLRSITIEQQGYNRLDLGTATSSGERLVTLPNTGAERRYIVPIESESWTATSSAEWLQVLALPRSGELVLKAQDNETVEARTTSVVLDLGSSQLSFQVKQLGKLHYLLPYNAWRGGLAEVELLEKARGSAIATTPVLQNDVDIPYYTFKTQSAAFPNVRYEFMSYGSDFLYATVLVASDPTIVYSQSFWSFLVEEGYTRISPADKTSGLIEYRHQEQGTNLYILTQTNDQGTSVGYVYLYPSDPKVEGTTPSFTFDPGFIDFTKSRADVEAWETSHSGQYDSEFSKALGVPFWFVPSPYFGRGYVFDTAGKLSRSILLYSKADETFTRIGMVAYPTQAWHKMMTGLGYTYLYFHPAVRSHIYIHQDKKIAAEMSALTLSSYYLNRVVVYSIATQTSSAQTSLGPVTAGLRAGRIDQLPSLLP